MLIAARNGFLAGGGWKNPYVTDGLIAMWDGEWNAGGGVHEQGLNTLTNLITGARMTLTGNGFRADENSVIIDSGISWRLLDSEGSLPDVSEFTLDIVAMSTSTTYGTFVSMTSTRSYPCRIKLQTQNGGRSGALGFGIDNVTYPIGLTGGVNKIQHKTAVVKRSSGLDIYTNGSKTQTYSYSGNFGGANPLCIGMQSGASIENASGHVFRVYLYSRALSAGEIISINDVDASRYALS